MNPSKMWQSLNIREIHVKIALMKKLNYKLEIKFGEFLILIRPNFRIIFCFRLLYNNVTTKIYKI
jgi:hypothetical protein